MPDYRLLEDGSYRITEDGFTRLLESSVEPTPTPIPDDDPPVAIYRLPAFTAVTEPVTQHGISGQRLKNEVGSGQFTINLDDPAYDLIEPGIDVMAFRRDGTTVHSCVIEEIDETTMDAQGGARQVATYKGRGAGIVLDWCPIFPAGGVRRKPVEDDAVFDWRSLRYDPSGDSWAAATQIMTVAVAEADGWPTQPMGEDFDLTTGAYMLWDSSGDETLAPDGICLFYRDIDITSGGRYGIELLMDNDGFFWVDGIQMLEISETESYHRVSFKRLQLSTGVHRFAFQVRNIPVEGGGPNPAALAYNLFKVDQQDHRQRDVSNALLPPVAVSDSNTQVLSYPADFPTMTVGDILMDLWLESIDNGFTVAHLDPTFTRTLDSNADAWPQIGTGSEGGITTKTGTTTIMGLLIEMQAAEHISQWRVRPDAIAWDVYGPGYTNRPTPTGFAAGVELEPSPVGDPRTGQVLLLDRRRT